LDLKKKDLQGTLEKGEKRTAAYLNLLWVERESGKTEAAEPVVINQ